MSKLSIFPLIKKYDDGTGETKSWHEKVSPETEVQRIAMHYTEQLIHHFRNHGFSDKGFFYQDIDFLNELLESILLRSVGKHHQMQDLVDEIMEDSLKGRDEDEVETEESKE